MTEEEEFQFRHRFESEQAGAAPTPRKRLTGSSAIPGMPDVMDAPVKSAADTAQSTDWKTRVAEILQQITGQAKAVYGGAETAAAMGTGAVGIAAGGLNMLRNAGEHGLRMATGQETASLPSAEQAFNAGAETFIRAPRTESGQAQTEAVGKFAQEHAPSVMALPSGSILSPMLRAGGGALRTAAQSLSSTASAGARGAAEIATRPIRQATGSIANRAAEGLKQEVVSKVDQQALVSARASANVAQDAQVSAKVRAAAVEQDALDSGLPVAEAKAEAVTAAQRVMMADKAATALEDELLARPRANAETFGTKLRGVTKQLVKTFKDARKEDAQFGKIIEDAGDALIVQTDTAQSKITERLKDSRNTTLQSTLGRLREQLTTPDETAAKVGFLDASGQRPAPSIKANENVLSLRAYDSVRKQIDGLISNKSKSVEAGGLAGDKDTLSALRAIQHELKARATEEGNPHRLAYKSAVESFSKLSRPLDMVERNGALKKTLVEDTKSTEYAMTEAEVTGHIINRANHGSPALKWIAQGGDIKEPARLYFTQELFGKDAMPQPSVLNNFLKKNEPALRQLGLYGEFKDIRTARETAQHAVTTAKEGLRAAGENVTAAEAQQKTYGAQAGEARTASTKATEALAAQKKATREYETFKTEIANAAPRDVAGKIQTLGRRMIDDGYLSNTQYDALIKQARVVQENYTNTKKMRIALGVVATIALGAGGKKAVDWAL